MSFLILIKPSGYVLSVNSEETILDAAIRQGYDFPYSCRSATCGTCMGRVISGDIEYRDIEPYALDENDQVKGYALFCSAYAKSDLVIEIEGVFGPEYRPVKTAEYKVIVCTSLSENVYQVKLVPVDEHQAIAYTAGQHIRIFTDEGMPVPFSIASAESEGEQSSLEFHIHETKTAVTQGLFSKIKQGQTFQVSGPFGKMVYRSEPLFPIIFIANGTGFAPLKAIIEACLAKGIKQEMHLYWSMSRPSRFYLQDLLQRWANNIPFFHFNLILPEPRVDWKGRVGALHEIVLQDFPDLSHYQVFASGSPDMVYAAQKAFIEKGNLHPYFIYSDVFEYFS